MDEIHINRTKENIYPLSIKKLTLGKVTGKAEEAWKFASIVFKDKPYLPDLIEASPVLFDSAAYPRRKLALSDNLVSPKDFRDDNEIMLVKKSKMEHLIKQFPEIRAGYRIFISDLQPIVSETVTDEDIAETYGAIQSLVYEDEIQYGEISHSTTKDCMLGYIPDKHLYDLVVQHNPEYVKHRHHKYKIINGEFRTRLW